MEPNTLVYLRHESDSTLTRLEINETIDWTKCLRLGSKMTKETN